MTFDWWTLGLQAVNFIVLVWILAHFLFRPVSRIIAERQAAAHSALDEAEAMRTEATAAREAARAETDAIATKRAVLIAKAREDAEQEKQRLIDDAGVAARKALAEGKADLERWRKAQAQDLSDQAGILAADIAARLLARLPDDARVSGFIDGLAEAVASLPETVRAGIGDTGPVRIRAARAVTPDEQTHLQERLGAVLGRAPELEIEVDQTLLAGLELDALHAVVRNHFRADLDRIKAELTQHV